MYEHANAQALQAIAYELKAIRLLLERMERRQIEAGQSVEMQADLSDEKLVAAIRNQFGTIFDSVDA